MKCWHEGCNKELRIGIIKVGICPEHGQVWEDDKPLTSLDKYIVGTKLAEGRLILQIDAAEKAAEDCVVLVIPKSEWLQIKKETIDEPHKD